MGEPVAAVTNLGIASRGGCFRWPVAQSRGSMLTACSQNEARDHAAAQQQQPDKNPRRKAATDSLDRSALPILMPTNAATSAIIAGAAMAPLSPLLRPSPSANANVDTNAEIANACTNSSLPRLSACTYGTPGTTKIPVAPLMSPVVRPISGPSRGSVRRETLKWTPMRPIKA